MNQLPLKASRISNLTDARYFAARGIDWLAFDLDQGSEAYISQSEIHAICEWVEGPKVVGSFGLLGADEILKIRDDLNLDAIQLHPFMPLYQLEVLEKEIIIQTFIVEGLIDLDQELIAFIKERSAFANYFSLDFSTNHFSWENIQEHQNLVTTLESLSKEHSIFFQLTFDNNNPLSFIEQVEPYALDIIAGSAEEKVGFKSFDDLDELLDHLEILD